jgi:adenylate cyclase
MFRSRLDTLGDRIVSSRPLQLVVLSFIVYGALTFAARLPAWSLLDNRVFDYLSTLSAPQLPPDSPVIVAIDEPSLSEIQHQWPWPRSLHAKLVTALREAGAKVIGMDIIFAEPSNPADDAALAAVLGPDVVLAGDETLVTSPQADQFVRVLPLPMFTAAYALTGIASVMLDRDGVLRRMPPYEDGFAAMVATAAGFDVPPVSDNNLLQVYGPARTYPTVSYYQALNPDQLLPQDFFKDRVVLVGLSLQNAATLERSGADAYATSYTVHSSHLTAGAEIQATIIDNIRQGSSITEAGRQPRQLLLLVGVIIAVLIARTGTGWRTLLYNGVGLAVVLGGSYLTLRFGRIFVSPFAPAIALVTVSAAQTGFDYARERAGRRQITQAFAQYLSPQLVDQLARDPSRLKLGGEKKELSILFCDVRGFTTIAEQLKDDPQQLTELVNRLLTPLSDIVLAHGGTIDKYIGDCLMAFWNAPLDDPQHADHAVSAALAMLGSMDGLNASLHSEAQVAGRSHYELRIGIGINTGECVVGNMGSSSRFDYSALGDAVNLAARLEGESKNLGVPLLIGAHTARRLSDSRRVVGLGHIVVKGKTEEVPVFTISVSG